MKSFSTIPKKRMGGHARQPSVITSFFGRMYEETMERTVKTKYGRAPKFRPSALPMCSIHVYMDLVKGANQGFFEQEMTAAGGYFTSVGTAAHENIQYYIGMTGRVWGDWSCITPGCQKYNDARNLFDENGKLIRPGTITAKNTVNNICPCCNHPMGYVEKEIRYRGLVGHIDCIVLLDNGHYWVADYKTCTKYKIQSKKLPNKAHLKQLPAYCYVLEKKYKMIIDGFSLLYLSRDNPFLFQEWSQKWNPTWIRRSSVTLKDERKKFIGGVRAFAYRDRQEAIATKPCACKEQYEDEIDFYETCPLLDVCFNKKKLNAYLEDIEQQYPYTNKSINKIIPTLNLSEGDI